MTNRNHERVREELLALFSHELKTPLTLILGWCQVLKNNSMTGKLNPEQMHAVSIVSANALRLKSDIEDILDTNKLIFGTMLFSFEDISLDKLIARIIRRIMPLAEVKNVRIENQCNSGTIIRTDEHRIEQVITNLVLNAVDFVPKNKGIITIGTKEDDDQVIFFVKDNGKGVRKNMQENIFEKLVQEDSTYRRKHSGLGLGLFLCKGIVESLGGQIGVESKIKKGSMFYFTHPKYSNLTRYALLKQASHLPVSELYSLVKKKVHDQRELEMARRLRSYVEKLRKQDFAMSLE